MRIKKPRSTTGPRGHGITHSVVSEGHPKFHDEFGRKHSTSLILERQENADPPLRQNFQVYSASIASASAPGTVASPTPSSNIRATAGLKR